MCMDVNIGSEHFVDVDVVSLTAYKRKMKVADAESDFSINRSPWDGLTFKKRCH